MQNNKTRSFYVLYSDKTYVFDQSERAHGPIYILKLDRNTVHVLYLLSTISSQKSRYSRVVVKFHMMPFPCPSVSPCIIELKAIKNRNPVMRQPCSTPLVILSNLVCSP